MVLSGMLEDIQNECQLPYDIWHVFNTLSNMRKYSYKSDEHFLVQIESHSSSPNINTQEICPALIYPLSKLGKQVKDIRQRLQPSTGQLYEGTEKKKAKKPDLQAVWKYNILSCFWME